ncbi:protein RKD1-like [Rhododendron vialii]|uniref:protein RKD1-like n=1 Tax=Rhododendron vialii TaxID=182163 RepID=UPI00265D6E5D|nr:protein RKD1-like [Rhododendron vialii]
MGYFHLPIEEAAREMKVCPTVMKKISRKHGLKRWPHRKIKSIEKKISTRRQSLNGNDAEERARAQCDIESFQQELAGMYRKAADAEMS